MRYPATRRPANPCPDRLAADHRNCAVCDTWAVSQFGADRVALYLGRRPLALT